MLSETGENLVETSHHFNAEEKGSRENPNKLKNRKKKEFFMVIDIQTPKLIKKLTLQIPVLQRVN